MFGGYVIVLAMNRAHIGFVAGAGARLHRHRRAQRRVRAAALSPALSRRRARPGAVHHRPRFSSSSPAMTLMVGPESQPLELPPALDAGQLNLGFMRYRTYSILLIVVGVADRARASGSPSSARGSARRSAPRSTTAAWRNRSASTSTGCSPSPSPSAAAWRRSAAGSAPSFSASIRNTAQISGVFS